MLSLLGLFRSHRHAFTARLTRSQRFASRSFRHRRVRQNLEVLEDRLLLNAAIMGLSMNGVQTTTAYGINDNGDVVGAANGGAFLYNGTTTVTIPGTGNGDIAYGINIHNQVVGVFANEQAFLSNNGNTPAPIGDVFSDNPVGPPFVGINSSGDVVGQQNPSGDAFLYNGTMNIVGPTSGFQSSAAYGINDKGQEVGFVQGENANNYAALFDGNGQGTELGALKGDNYSVANAINASGVVVGYSSSSGGGSGNRPFRWIPSSPNATTGTMFQIGASEGVANGINSDGWVVGQESTSSGTLDAFVYQPGQNGTPGQMIDLNSLTAVTNAGWTLTDAYAINDNNYIVGTGIGPNGPEAFLLNFNAAAGGVGGVGTITTLASFNGNSGSGQSGVIMDGSGNLYGTTYGGGSSGDGTVFELAKGSSTITTLASFNGNNGSGPSGLIMDGSGNLYGTTYGSTLSGGSPGDGTVFELAKSSSTITTLASFNGDNGSAPVNSLIMDGSGNLFGTTEDGGDSNAGTIFELAKGSSIITTLASFNSTYGGSVLPSGLIMDGSGNLYGTMSGGSSGYGTVFELAKGNYTITTLASFNGTNGSGFEASLIMDGTGTLYGTTTDGGSSDAGTVFELAKGSSTITTLASFNGTNGSSPVTSLIMDGSGNLYGTTNVGGSSDAGTVFELAKGSSTITTLASFNVTNGVMPNGGLIMDGSGNLYGTTASGGPADGGTIFEVQLSTSGTRAPVTTSGNSAIFTVGQTASFTVTATGSPTPTLTESGALPSGVTFTDNGNGTASLSGTPALNTNGTYHVTITAHNGIGSDFTQNFTLTVNPSLPPPPHVYPPPNVPPLLALFDSLLGGVQTDNADGTETITDRLFGIPLLVSTFDSSGNLESVLLFGFNVTALFELL